MFSCPLCKNEYLIFSSLCVECTKIKHIISLYGSDEVHAVLNKILLRGTDHINKSIIKELEKK